VDRKRRGDYADDVPMDFKKSRLQGGDDGEENEDEGVACQPGCDDDGDVPRQPVAEDGDGASQFEGDDAVVPEGGNGKPDSDGRDPDASADERSSMTGNRGPQVCISVNFTRLLQQRVQKQVRALKWIQLEQAMMRDALVALRDDMKAELDHLRTLPK
jgi:hypothetical protein